MPKTKKTVKKIFVLDTSVIIFDPHCFFNFQDNDILIPIAVLEELDNMKKGTADRNFAARDAIRTIEHIACGKSLKQWVPIRRGLGRLRVFTDIESDDAIKIFEVGKNDHRILNTARRMMQTANLSTPVIMVSKDINLRLKAMALDIPSEDYKSGMVKTTDETYTGKSEIVINDSEKMTELISKGFIDAKCLTLNRIANMYYTVKCGELSTIARYDKKTNTIVQIKKHNAYGISPRNDEQAFAMDAIMNPDIKLVTLEGHAGTGKTLVSIASVLLIKQNYEKIYLTKPIIQVGGKDNLGYLPGSAVDKTAPYMVSFNDAIDFIKNKNVAKSNNKSKKIDALFENEKIVMELIAYVRGRSISDTIWIIDETQNLSKHEVKSIITRSGENTKLILIGDHGQIDTQYLDKKSNGLAHIIDKFKGYDFYAHVTLDSCQRSELADIAGRIL